MPPLIRLPYPLHILLACGAHALCTHSTKVALELAPAAVAAPTAAVLDFFVLVAQAKSNRRISRRELVVSAG